MADTGKLIVQARAGRGAVPVVGAVVTVYCPDSQEPCLSVRTDMSGSTEELILPAPNRDGMSNEQAPPYTAYKVDIDHPDYRPVTVLDVAVFSGITTRLPVTMIPPRSLAELNKRVIITTPETGPTGSSSIGGEENA